MILLSAVVVITLLRRSPATTVHAEVDDACVIWAMMNGFFCGQIFAHCALPVRACLRAMSDWLLCVVLCAQYKAMKVAGGGYGCRAPGVLGRRVRHRRVEFWQLLLRARFVPHPSHVTCLRRRREIYTTDCMHAPYKAHGVEKCRQVECVGGIVGERWRMVHDSRFSVSTAPVSQSVSQRAAFLTLSRWKCFDVSSLRFVVRWTRWAPHSDDWSVRRYRKKHFECVYVVVPSVLSLCLYTVYKWQSNKVTNSDVIHSIPVCKD